MTHVQGRNALLSIDVIVFGECPPSKLLKMQESSPEINKLTAIIWRNVLFCHAFFCIGLIARCANVPISYTANILLSIPLGSFPTVPITIDTDNCFACFFLQPLSMQTIVWRRQTPLESFVYYKQWNHLKELTHFLCFRAKNITSALLCSLLIGRDSTQILELKSKVLDALHDVKQICIH